MASEGGSGTEGFSGYTKVIVRYDEQDETGSIYFPSPLRDIKGIACRSLTITDQQHNIHPFYGNDMITYQIEVVPLTGPTLTHQASYQLYRGNFDYIREVTSAEAYDGTLGYPVRVPQADLPHPLVGQDMGSALYSTLVDFLNDSVGAAINIDRVYMDMAFGKLVREFSFVADGSLPTTGVPIIIPGATPSWANVAKVRLMTNTVGSIFGMYHLPNVKNVQATNWNTVEFSVAEIQAYISTEIGKPFGQRVPLYWWSQDRVNTQVNRAYHLTANHLFPNAYIGSDLYRPLTILQSYYPIEEWGAQSQVVAQNREIVRFPTRIDLDKLQLVLVNHEGKKIVDGTWIAEIHLYF